MRSKLKEWKALEKHAKKFKKLSLNNLFADDPNRFANFHVHHDDALLDFSKQPLTTETLENLLNLAEACDLRGWQNRMFSGEAINTTEGRAVLHTALRNPGHDPILVDGQDIMPDIHNTLERMKTFSDDIRDNQRFTHIVNIGIGGSDLGTSMAYKALLPFTDRDITLHFVSNIDATHLAEVLRVVEPEKTLFVITSKTFTTQETMTNARSAKAWMQETLGKDDVSAHFIAATQNVEKANEFGISSDRIFPIWDWVGGRYSLWSAIGLPLCIALGFENFRAMLDGAHSMDKHFQSAEFSKNMPVLMALIGVWHRNFLDHSALSVVPYDQYLSLFPSYLQQLDMESNGKSVDRNDKKIPYQTGPIVLGEPGTNAQHAYFQLLHQGTSIVPCDFIFPVVTQNPIGGHHNKLMANALAQSKAMMEGRVHDNPHQVFEGNRPSNTILFKELTPYCFGMLLALYEHKIFVQGVIWNINSFDQCGVELGKIMANQLVSVLSDGLSDDDQLDSSTAGLIQAIESLR